MADRGRSLLPHLKAHVLLFEPKPAVVYPSSSGLRLLLIFLFLEVVIGPRMALWRGIGLQIPPWVRVPLLLAAALTLVRFAAGRPLPDIGLYSWRKWTTPERSYFVQVIVIANVVFWLMFGDRVRTILAGPKGWLALATYVLWGFYQEVMYRGILQTELTRRWGGVAGVLVSNLFYTFGPLHSYHTAPAIFAAIFAIGLFFGVLFNRTRNLWLPGIFHGIGDAYITGTLPMTG